MFKNYSSTLDMRVLAVKSFKIVKVLAKTAAWASDVMHRLV
jgi:hypothetical protein